MNMDTLVEIVDMVDWLILPLTYFILLVLFIFFVVRPFFAHLFDSNRLKAIKAQKEAKLAAQKEKENEEAANKGEDKWKTPSMYSQDDNSQSLKAQQEEISKLAETDPEKAGELVRQWIQKDKD